MFQKIAKHRANDASLTMHRPPLTACSCSGGTAVQNKCKSNATMVKYRCSGRVHHSSGGSSAHFKNTSSSQCQNIRRDACHDVERYSATKPRRWWFRWMWWWRWWWRWWRQRSPIKEGMPWLRVIKQTPFCEAGETLTYQHCKAMHGNARQSARHLHICSRIEEQSVQNTMQCYDTVQFKNDTKIQWCTVIQWYSDKQWYNNRV